MTPEAWERDRDGWSIYRMPERKFSYQPFIVPDEYDPLDPSTRPKRDEMKEAVMPSGGSVFTYSGTFDFPALLDLRDIEDLDTLFPDQRSEPRLTRAQKSR